MNRNLSNTGASATVAFNNLAYSLKQQGKKIVSLAGGDPDFDTPQRIRDALKKAVDEGRTHYCESRGIKELRERIALKLREENSIDCTAENILVTPGAKYAVKLALSALLNPGDEVLIPQPSWVSYEALTALCGAEPVPVPLDIRKNYVLDEETLEKHITGRTRVLIINSPNNPTGHVMRPCEWDAVSAAVKRHDLYLVSDEVYENIIFDGMANASPASSAFLKDRTVTVNSFSKTYAMTGWRLGYMCAPSEIIDLCYQLLSHEISCVNEAVQYAALQAFNCRKESLEMREEYQRRRDYLTSELSQIPGFEVLKCEGAFYLWVRCDGTDALSLLEKTGVVTVPGSAFGKGGEGFIRFCFSYSMKDLEEAVRRIRDVYR